MKPRRSIVFLLACLLAAAGIVGAVAPVLAAAAHHCDHADLGADTTAPMPSAPCCGDCTSAPDCAQVCAPPYIAPSASGHVAYVAQSAPAGTAVASRSWIALPQTRPPIA